MSLADTLSTLQAQVASLMSAMSGMPRVPRMQWGTVTALSPLTVTLDGDTAPCGVSWSAEVVTVGARVLVQVQGQDRWIMALASATSPWTAYTPTLGGLTLGNGSVDARYQQVGRTVYWNAQITWGSTSAWTGGLSVSLPLYAIRTGGGSVLLLDSGVAWYTGMQIVSGSTSSAFPIGASGIYAAFGPSTPFTWSTGDGIFLSATYETT